MAVIIFIEVEPARYMGTIGTVEEVIPLNHMIMIPDIHVSDIVPIRVEHFGDTIHFTELEALEVIHE